MKKLVLLVLISLLLACGNKNQMEKPDKLIEKPVMENIMYDLALLQALRGYSTEKLIANKIDQKTYVYQKYKIDSTQFAQSNKYYASEMEDYKKMFQNVSERLQKQKTQLDTIIKRQERIKSKKISDSLAKITPKKSPIQEQKKNALQKIAKAQN
jgi:hypothetical protein